MITSKDLKINVNSNRSRLLVNVDGSDSYLRLRKDNLAIPKEFYNANGSLEEDSLEFEN
jgi:hypothetical protein